MIVDFLFLLIMSARSLIGFGYVNIVILVKKGWFSNEIVLFLAENCTIYRLLLATDLN